MMDARGHPTLKGGGDGSSVPAGSVVVLAGPQAAAFLSNSHPQNASVASGRGHGVHGRTTSVGALRDHGYFSCQENSAWYGTVYRCYVSAHEN